MHFTGRRSALRSGRATGGARTTQYEPAPVGNEAARTSYGPGPSGPGSFTRFIEDENGIFSANAIKARGTTVLSVGIGDVGASTANLAAISGPREGTDYFATDFGQLASPLRTLAEKNCLGTVNVVKKVVRASAPDDLNAAGPESDWEYERKLLEPGDLDEALHAAAVVGDDFLQQSATGSVQPEKWTHGSSQQREQWLLTGYRTGKPADCDTFATR